MNARRTFTNRKRAGTAKFAPHSRSLFAEEIAPVAKKDLTEEQHSAIYSRDVSIGLSAGAGCGKTLVLTRRFLTHLEPTDLEQSSSAAPLSRVVAITFTDRAAREMRDRIRAECARRLRDSETEPEALHWLSILRGLDAARISTIHSFCSGLLRRHAVAARIDPEFRPLEMEIGEALLRQSVARTVKRLLEAGDPNCFRLLTEFGLEPLRRALRKLVINRATVDPKPFKCRTAGEFADKWLNHLHDVFLPRAARDLGASDVTSQILRLLKDNVPQNQTMQDRRRALLAGLNTLRQAETPEVAQLFELRESAKVQGGGGKSAWPDENSYEEVRDSLERLRDKIDDLKEFATFDRREVEQAAETSAALVSVVEAAAGDFSAAKAEAGVLDFDDLLAKTRDLLRSSPEARHEAAASIDALLVDEFQDTDRIQAEIVEALVGGGLSTGKLFVVGDSKQSIYRFRGADPAVFDATRKSLPERGRLPLTHNFRSQPEIINFVNSLFAPVMQGYEPLVPNRTQLSPRPSVEFLFAFPGSGEESDSDPNSLEEHRRREAEWIARRILALLNDPTPRIPERDPESHVERLRRVRAGDIAVLFRAMSDAAIYEDVFRRRSVDYYLVGGRAFFAQQEVYDLVNLCTFLNDPADSIALVGVLRSPLFSLSDDTIVAMTHVGELSLREALRQPPSSELPETQREQIRQAARVIDELFEQKDRIPLAKLLELAIDRTAYDASLLCEFLGRRKVANLRKLIEMARRFDRSGIGTLADFTRRIQDSVSDQTIEDLAATHPESSNVVRLMTIHQAKGLEFPVVILADMERKNRGSFWDAVYHREFGPIIVPPKFGSEEPRHPAIQMHKYVEDREDDEESLRILYVALTRAADHLILSAGIASDPGLGGCSVRSQWLRLVAERYDLGTGMPKTDPYFDSMAGHKWGSAATPRRTIPDICVHRMSPELTVVPRPDAKAAKLSQWRELAETAEPSPLPPLIGPVAPKYSGPLNLSVSQIEEADALLRSAKLPRPNRRKAAQSGTDNTLEPLGESATLAGSLVHRVIERLPLDTKVDSDRVATGVQAVLKSLSARSVDAFDPEIMVRRVNALVESELWDEMRRATRCFREIEFLLGWPVGAAVADRTAVIAGTLDCLLLSPEGEWKILDYKTGRLPEGDPAALREHFAIQLVLYGEAVRAMVGRPPESIEIVAVHDKLGRFPLVLWDEFRAPVHERIDAAIGHLSTTAGPAIDPNARFQLSPDVRT
ncbi:MAG TPA: UvrD-helicase domain-containing protein [Planctomycetaceae bacterium]|jgi:ATP-dependent helicase/nuclease subunit A|nr:UvrD-helicase domain-containing protein [Planctomycetaceae bacterium]